MKLYFTQKLIKQLMLSAVAIISVTNASAQNTKTVFYPSTQLTLVGKATNTPQMFHRVDTSQNKDLSERVKKLLTNSAGLAMTFKTNSKTIKAKWCVTDSKASNNLTPIAQKGLDLYIKKEGKWIFAGVARPNKTCSEYTIVQNMDNTEKECLLYLPLYDELKSLEVGVDENSTLVAAENPFKKKIVIYGSSIAHGASASRPGLAYPSILSRRTGLNFINLGISGNGKMEDAAAKMVSDIEADAYIMDCVPNPTPAQIKARTEKFAQSIRKAHPNKPIIFIESIIREQGNFDLVVKNNVNKQNEEFRAAFKRLQNAGMKDIYLISSDKLTGDDHESSVDGTHPNDLGFARMVDEIGMQLGKIFARYNIK